MKKKQLLAERDGLDWAIRQLRAEGQITMEQMILIFRCWSAVSAKGGRLTDKQLRKVIEKYQNRNKPKNGVIVTSLEVAQAFENFKAIVPLSHVVAAYKARTKK